jgi:hypothetical protein
MKKFVTAAFTLLMTILTLPVVPVSASAKESDYNGWGGDASQSKFVDDVDYFSDSEEQEINEKIQETAQELEMNILVLAAGSNYYMSDSATEEFCDDSYDSTFGNNTDGVFFFMDFTGKQPAYDYISTSGKAVLFYQDDLDNESMINMIHRFLPSSDLDASLYTDDIAEGIYCFLDQLESRQDGPSYYYDPDSDYYFTYGKNGELEVSKNKPLRARLKAFIFALPIGLIAGIIYFFVT